MRVDLPEPRMRLRDRATLLSLHARDSTAQVLSQTGPTTVVKSKEGGGQRKRSSASTRRPIPPRSLRQILDDFGGFWTTEPEPAERRKLLAELFQAIWQKDGQIVAVKPQPSLAPYFTAIPGAQGGPAQGPKRRSE
jgi:hypothetical protein